jgi:hypothetical protein
MKGKMFGKILSCAINSAKMQTQSADMKQSEIISTIYNRVIPHKLRKLTFERLNFGIILRKYRQTSFPF